MHLRGKSFQIYAESAEGKKTILMNVPKYSFSWQQMYVLAEPVRLSPGTKVHYVAAYDNSSQNTALFQYDTPDREVTWGERTIDEMMGGHVFYTHDGEHLGIVVDGNTGAVVSRNQTTAN
ncbi:MAG: hypothetical protein L0387_08095 [Acidobacteria bacterium]|nr:hypothetical protein [Acidobacteriota bacterium]MCI0720873.1 hypothetical protein [Acidobacteriota bacterium]